jgi:hydrogenase maturation factor
MTFVAENVWKVRDALADAMGVDRERVSVTLLKETLTLGQYRLVYDIKLDGKDLDDEHAKKAFARLAAPGIPLR